MVDQSQNIGDNSDNNKQYKADTIIINENGKAQAIDANVKTIIDLMGYIATHVELQEGDLENIMPDPEEKIFRRFADYCNEISDEIVENASYAIAQKEAENAFGLDKITVGKITAYLKRESRRMLRENNNEPMTALDKLTDHFEEILKMNEDNHYERNAIRYYLIGEIPKCNVFPNESNR